MGSHLLICIICMFVGAFIAVTLMAAVALAARDDRVIGAQE